MNVAPSGGVPVSTKDRQVVLERTIHEVKTVNNTVPTLFLSKSALVTVFDGSIFYVAKPAQFKGWCVRNGVTFVNHEGNNQFAPDDVSAICVLDTPIWGHHLPRLNSISTLPFAHKDGSFVSTFGYDKETGVYCTDTKVGAFAHLVPEAPNQENARLAAKWLLDEVFTDFPFVSQADKANALGLLLSALTRYIHNRPSPLWGVTAPDAGTGKGLLTAVLSMILQGTTPEMRTLSSSTEEQRKAITGVLKDSANPVVVWDNIETGSKVRSSVLCMLHTADSWSDRVLGTSNSVEFANDRIWIATGNNIGPADDMVRRWVQIRLDAGVPHPEQRKGFKHRDLKAWVLENRHTAIAALHTMIKAWHLAGQPRPTENTPVVGDYQPIVNTVGGILNFAGIDGFLMNTDDVRDEAAAGSDAEVSEDFLHWLYGAMPLAGYELSGFNAQQVQKAIQKIDGAFSANLTDVPLPQPIAENLSKGSTATSVSITAWLASHEGQRFGYEGFRVVKLKNKVDRRAAYALTVEATTVDLHPLVAQSATRLEA